METLGEILAKNPIVIDNVTSFLNGYRVQDR